MLLLREYLQPKGNSSVLTDTKIANGTQSCGLVILDSYCVHAM